MTTTVDDLSKLRTIFSRYRWTAVNCWGVYGVNAYESGSFVCNMCVCQNKSDAELIAFALSKLLNCEVDQQLSTE